MRVLQLLLLFITSSALPMAPVKGSSFGVTKVLYYGGKRVDEHVRWPEGWSDEEINKRVEAFHMSAKLRLTEQKALARKEQNRRNKQKQWESSEEFREACREATAAARAADPEKTNAASLASNAKRREQVAAGERPGFVYNWVARYNALVWLDGSETKKRELALEYKELIFLQSFGRCYLTWQPMLGGLSGYLLDRIKNSDRLYHLMNCLPAAEANFAKGEYRLVDTVKLAVNIWRYQCGEPTVYGPEDFDEGFFLIKQTDAQGFSDYKYRHTSDGAPLETFRWNDVQAFELEKQNAVCHYTGFCASPEVGHTFDRQDSSIRGYSEGDQVVACLWPVNKMKRKMPDADFRTMCEKMATTWGSTLAGVVSRVGASLEEQEQAMVAEVREEVLRHYREVGVVTHVEPRVNKNGQVEIVATVNVEVMMDRAASLLVGCKFPLGDPNSDEYRSLQSLGRTFDIVWA